MGGRLDDKKVKDGENHMDIIEILTELIDEDKDQPRYQFSEESLQELMQSIEELGLLSPIKVRSTPGGRYKIIYGNRRYKACKALDRQTIPCIVSTVTDEMEIYLEQIAENLTREGFSPIEEAEAFNKLLNNPKFTSSTKFLSSKLGKPESYIKNKCDLLKFGDAVKRLIVSGTEIKQNQLTEEQLLPIKDLPIEHRDPLALIIAKDELAVSDVKKIARLFKDKEIPNGTKDKLLYKSGHGLIETWSVYQQNKNEREKPVEPKVSKAATESKKLKEPQVSQESKNSVINDEHGKETNGEVNQIKEWIASLPQDDALPHRIIQSLHGLKPEAKEELMNDIDLIVETLEKHLSEWKNVKEMAKKKPSSIPLS